MRLRSFRSMLTALGVGLALAAPAYAQHHHDGGFYHDGHYYPHPGFGPHFEDHWHGGYWRHEWHGGRLGWWWVVGPSWYYYPAPVYPYPNPYIPPSIPAPVGPMWYWCGAPAGYYPYVGQCGVPWQAVPPR